VKLLLYICIAGDKVKVAIDEVMPERTAEGPNTIYGMKRFSSKSSVLVLAVSKNDNLLHCIFDFMVVILPKKITYNLLFLYYKQDVFISRHNVSCKVRSVT